MHFCYHESFCVFCTLQPLLHSKTLQLDFFLEIYFPGKCRIICIPCCGTILTSFIFSVIRYCKLSNFLKAENVTSQLLFGHSQKPVQSFRRLLLRFQIDLPLILHSMGETAQCCHMYKMALVTIVMNYLHIYLFNIFQSRLIIKVVSVSTLFVIVFPCLAQFTEHIRHSNTLRDLLDCQV